MAMEGRGTDARSPSRAYKESDSLPLSHFDEHKIMSHTQARKTLPLEMIVARSVQQTSPTGEDSAICGGALVWSGAHRTATIKEKHPLRGDASPSGLVSTGCPSQVRKLQTWAVNHTLWLAVASPVLRAGAS